MVNDVMALTVSTAQKAFDNIWNAPRSTFTATTN